MNLILVYFYLGVDRKILLFELRVLSKFTKSVYSMCIPTFIQFLFYYSIFGLNIDNLYSYKDNVGKPEQEIWKILSEYYGTLVIKCEIIMILIKGKIG